ncbi:MAG: hypothetical protein QG602_2055 [Verrucomicrobiota bacterium]|nr:hypothetical protein [Verrucomicrobiota bacterium]
MAILNNPRSIVLSFLLGAAVISQAAPTVYSGSDQGAGSASPRPNSDAAAAAFDTAASSLGSVNVIDFESAPLGSFTNLVVAPGVTINGSDYYSSPQTIRDLPFGTPDSLFGYNTTLGGDTFLGIYGGSVTFSFAPTVIAFGAYFSGLQVASQTITYTSGSTETIYIPNLSSGIAFVGFTDANASIASITVNSLNDIVGIDDVRYVTDGNNRVPDATATLPLLGLAMAGLAVLRRRVQSRS